MTIRIPSARLVGMLADLARTAHSDPEVGGATAAVLLYSDHGHHGTEPGKGTVLAGLSMNRRVIGHAAEPASAGSLPPTLLPIGDVLVLIAALKQKCKGEKDNGPRHSVSINLVGGDRVEVIEDADEKPLFGESPWSLSCATGRLDDFPRGAWDVLASAEIPRDVIDTDRGRVPVRPRTDFNGADLAPLASIAARRKCGIEMYRHHQRRPIAVQIGSSYRAAIIPGSYPDWTTEGLHPDAPIYIPQLPPRKTKPDGPAPVDLDTQQWAQNGESTTTADAETEPLFSDTEVVLADARAALVDTVADAADALQLADHGDRVPVELLADAARLVIETQLGSRATVQRRLRIGKALSGRVMAELETLGVVGPSDGANARDVLVLPDQLAEVLATIRGA